MCLGLLGPLIEIKYLASGRVQGHKGYRRYANSFARNCLKGACLMKGD
jgi:hypothetical protein